MAFPSTGDTVSGSNAITNLSDTTDISVGMLVTCASFPTGTLVASVDDSTSISVTNNATATSTGVAVSFSTLLSGDGNVTVQTSVTLGIRNLTFSGSGKITVKPDPAGISLTIRNATLKGKGRVTVTPDPTGISLFRSVSFTSRGNSVFVESSTSLSMDIILASKNNANKITVTTRVSLDRGMVGIGVCHVMREIMSLWGVEEIGSVNDTIRERALNDLNAALQMIWSHSKDRDYWTRATIDITVTAGQPSYLFDDTIQSVIGPVLKTEDFSPLIPLTTIGDVKGYDKRFRGGLTHGEASGDVEAYFIDRRGQDGNDPVKVTLEVAPTPIEDTELQVDVVKEAPRFKWSDYCDCTHIPIPHKYIESLLIPICKFKAMSHRLFYRKEAIPAITREYVMAMQQLDINDPQSLPDQPQQELETDDNR